MQKNKVTTYLLYAIGEIVLVVIGILIAVSLNNWNNQRQNRTLESKILTSLKQDLQKDTAHFNVIINSIQRQQRRTDSLIRILNHPDADATVLRKVIISYEGLRLIADSQINAGTYTSIINAGTINILDPSLQKQLAVWNSNRNTYQEYIRENVDSKLDSYQRFSAVIPVPAGKQRFTIPISDAIKEDVWSTMNWIQAKVVFLNHIAVFKLTDESSLNFTRQIKQETENTLSVLENIQTAK